MRVDRAGEAGGSESAVSDGVDPTTGGAGEDDVGPPPGAVGLVAGTEDSTPLLFRVAVAQTPTCSSTTWC